LIPFAVILTIAYRTRYFAGIFASVSSLICEAPVNRLFETDFLPGEDMMATLSVEPYGKERFEMELVKPR
jgi:hypothetical protein